MNTCNISEVYSNKQLHTWLLTAQFYLNATVFLYIYVSISSSGSRLCLPLTKPREHDWASIYVVPYIFVAKFNKETADLKQGIQLCDFLWNVVWEQMSSLKIPKKDFVKKKNRSSRLLGIRIAFHSSKSDTPQETETGGSSPPKTRWTPLKLPNHSNFHICFRFSPSRGAFRYWYKVNQTPADCCCSSDRGLTYSEFQRFSKCGKRNALHLNAPQTDLSRILAADLQNWRLWHAAVGFWCVTPV